jgi:hypothetical protein
MVNVNKYNYVITSVLFVRKVLVKMNFCFLPLSNLGARIAHQ